MCADVFVRDGSVRSVWGLHRVLVMALLAFAPGVWRADADDVGNTPAEATVVSVGVSWHMFETGSDVDVFKVALEADTDYVIFYEPRDWGEADVVLYDTDGATVLREGSSATVFTPAAGGDYYVSLQPDHSGVQGVYALVIQTYTEDDHPNRADLVGPTDALTAAEHLGVEIPGTFEVKGDSDFFSFQGTVGTHYQFKAQSTYLQVYDASGALLTPGLASTVYAQTPNSRAGLLYVEARMDYQRDYKLLIEEVPLADVTIDSLTVSAPAVREDLTLGPNDQFDITTVLSNPSDADWMFNNLSVIYYLSTDETISADDILLAESQYYDAPTTLVAGGTAEIGPSPYAQTSWPNGTYYVLAEVNPRESPNPYQAGYYNPFPESDITNNTASSGAGNTITVDMPDYPDLQVTAVDVQLPTRSLTVDDQAEVTVSWTVENFGSVATPDGASWPDAIYYTADPTGATFDPWSDVLLGRFHSGVLDAAGGATTSYSDSATLTLPHLLGGPYYIVVDTDAGYYWGRGQREEGHEWGPGMVPEGANEKNNKKVFGPITITQPDKPDLAIANLAFPQRSTTLALGEATTVSYDLVNQGSVPLLADAENAFAVVSDQTGLKSSKLGNQSIVHNPAQTLYSTDDANGWGTAYPNKQVTAGTYTLVWETSRDMYDNRAPEAWIDNVNLPGGTEMFDAEALPTGWYTDAAHPWTVDVTENSPYGQLIPETYSLKSPPLPEGAKARVWTVVTFEEDTWVGSFHRRTTEANWGAGLRFKIIKGDGVLDPGESLPVTTQLTLPTYESMVGTDRYLMLTLDYADRIAEEIPDGELNNWDFLGPVEIIAPSPDLQITDLRIPEGAESNSNVDLTFDITNLESATKAANGYITIGYEYSDDGGTSFTDWGTSYSINLSDLQPGSTTAVTRSRNIPPGVSSWHIRLEVDVYNATGEIGEARNNNITTFGPFEFADPANAADLVPLVDAEHPFVFPEVFNPADTLVTSWHTANVAPGNIEAQYWYDDVYLSADTVYSPDEDIEVASRYHSYSDSLPVGESLAVEGAPTYDAEDIPPGEYYVILRVDGTGGDMVEFNDEYYGTDNNSYLWQDDQGVPKTTRVPAIDLVPTALEVPSLISGIDITVTAKVRNDGDGDVPVGKSFQQTLVLSTNTVYGDEDDVVWKSQFKWYDGGIPAGTTASLSQSVPAPDVAAGIYYVFVDVDTKQYSGYVVEFNADGTSAEDNNLFMRPTPVEVVQPDLIVTDLSWAADAEFSLGAPASVSVTVRNANAGTAQSWRDDLYVVTPDRGTVKVANHYHSAGTDGPLGPGEERTYSIDFTMPADLPVGSYPFRLDADAGLEVAESSETNNSLTSASTFDLDACDLVVTAAEIPGTAKGGAWMTINYTLQNRGEGTTPTSTWVDHIFLSDSVETYSTSAAATLYQPSAYEGDGPIPPGETREVLGATVWIDETQPVDDNGQFFVHIVLDNDTYRTVPEAHNDGQAEANNHYVSQGISRGTFDLVVTAPASPAATDALGSAETPLLSGTTIDVPFTVANQGNFRAAGNWTDDVHFSLDADTAISDGDILLLRDYGEKSVDSGGSYSSMLAVDLPEWQGAWDGVADLYLKVRIDAWNSMNEHNETDGGEGNNIGVYRLHFAETPAVDLEVTAVDVPGTPVPDGGTARITYDITNNGELDAAGRWVDRIRIRKQDDDSTVRWVSRYSNKARDTLWTRGQWETRTLHLPAGKHTLTWVFERTSNYGVVPDSAYLDNIVLPGIGTEDFEGVANPADVGFVSSTDEGTRAEHWRIEDDGTNAFATAGPAEVGDIMMLTYTGTFTAGDLVYDALIDSHSLKLYVDDIIPAGETRRYFYDWELEDGASGDYYAHIETDAYRDIDEPGHEDNNAMQSDPFSVALQPYADLQVTQARVSSGTVQTGAVIEVEWTVGNFESFGGGKAATGTWRDILYLSEDAVLDRQADRYVTAVNHEQAEPGLAVDETYTETASVPLPDGPATTWYIFVVTDTTDQVFEHDLNDNNTLATPLQLDAARGPYPDLLPFHIGVPDSIGAGSDFTAYWKVENAGDGVPGSNWYDTLYLSTNGTTDLTGDQYLGSQGRDGVNMPFSTDTLTSFYTGERAVDIGWHMEPGTYYLKIEVDNYERVFEYNSEGAGETNNILVSAPFTVTETPTPNLVVTNVNMEPLEVRGVQLQMDVEWTVQNIGSASTGQAAWYDHLYLSTTPNLYGQATKIAEAVNQSYLGVGDSYTQTLEVTIPWEFAEGDYYLVVKTDARGWSPPHDVIEYQAEDDNVSFSTNAAGQPFVNHIPFLVEPHAYASVLSTYAGDEAYPNVSQEPPLEDEGDIVLHTPIVTTGQRISASWTVKNTGNAAMTGNRWDDGWALSTDPYYDSSDFWLGSHNYHYRALAVGAYDRLENNVSERSIPITMPAGEYYLLIVADTHSFGSAYSGNIGVAPAKVIVHQAPPADLLVVPESIQCTAPESEWRTGARLSFRWRVENRGWWPTNERFIRSTLSLVPVDAPDQAIELGRHARHGVLDIVPSPPDANDDWYYEVVTTWDVPPDFVPIDQGSRSFRIQVTAGESNFEGAPEHYPNAKDNNTATGPQTLIIAAEDPGDLLPTELKVVTPVADLKPAALVELQWVVKNKGPEAMDSGSLNWRDSVYIASADTPEDRDRLITRYVRSPDGEPLEVDESYTALETMRLPEELPERLVFIVEVDSARQVFEKYETNNEFVSEPILPPVPTAPDLAVSAPVLTRGTSYESGDELSLSYTVTNSGGDTPHSQRRWFDCVVLSADTVLGNEDDQDFATHQRNNGLPGTASDGGSAADNPEAATYTVTKHVALPFDMEGTWYLFVETDSGEDLAESDEENNDSGANPVQFSVTLAEAPDLVVSSIDWGQADPDITPDGEGNPATVLAGQTINNVQFTVTNQSATAETGDARWMDAVYLSRDRILGRGDKRVASHAFQGNLGPGAAYPQPAAVDIAIPKGTSGEFYIIVETDSGYGSGRVEERAGEANNVTCSEHAFMVELPTNSAQEGDEYFDLQVDSVVPSQGRADIPIQPGQDMRVVWTVTNAGTRDLENAAWNDAVYLSADAEWDSDDTFVGTVRASASVPAGQSYTQDVTFPLPAIDEGVYYVIVRADVRQNVPEPLFQDPELGTVDLEENNEGASAADSLIDTSVPFLTIEDDVNDLDEDGITHKDQVTASLETEDALYYRVDTEAGFDLRVSLTCEDRAASTELFVKFGAIPSPADTDYVFTNHFRPDQEIIVPGTRDGSYYIMVRGDEVPNGPADATLTVQYLAFEILSVEPAAVGNAGPVTFAVDGAMFTPDMAVVLRGSGGTEIPAAEQFFVSPNRLHATLDLARAAVGTYDMVLKSADSAERGEAVLAGAVTVSQGRGGRLTTRLIAPNAVRPGNQHLVWIEYANLGDADVPAPLLHLSTRTKEGVDVRLYNDDPWRQDFIQLLGVNRAGPADRIPPGATFAIPVTFRVPAVGRHTFIVKVLDTIDGSLDWPQMEANLANDEATDSEQAAMLRYLRGHFGTTYRSFAVGLRQDALRRWRQGQPEYDVRALLSFAAARGYENDISVISGFLRDEDTGSALSYVPLALFSTDGDIYSEATDADGAFNFSELPPGSYELFAEGYVLSEDVEAQLTLDTDAIGLLATGFSAEEADVPSADPLQPADTNVAMTRTADGTLHLVWIRDRQIWHAVRDADSASWRDMSEDAGGPLPGAAVPGAQGTEPRVLDGGAASTRLAAGEIVLIWRTGADPETGLNASQAMYAIGRPVEDPETAPTLQYQWTQPAALTQGQYGDTQVRGVLTESDDILAVFLQQDWDQAQDDPDLYFKTLALPADPVFEPLPLRNSSLTLAPSRSAGGQELRGGKLTFSKGFSKDFGKGSVPSFIPLIGGDYGAKANGAIQLELQKCSVSGKAQLVGEASTPRFTLTGSADMSSGWKASKKRCKWMFNGATLALGVGGEVKIPFSWPPPPLIELEVGGKLGLQATGKVIWRGSNAGGKSRDTELELTLQGGLYGEATFLKDWLEAQIDGAAFVTGDYRVKEGFGIKEYGLKASASVSSWFTTYTFEKEWKKTRESRALELGVSRTLLDPDTLRITRREYRSGTLSVENLTIARGASTGTGNDYSEDGALPVEGLEAVVDDPDDSADPWNGVIDANPTIARNADGSEILVAWAQESANMIAAEGSGTHLMLARYTPGRAETWTLLPPLEDAYWLNRAPVMVYDSKDDPWVFWARSKADVSFSSLIADIYEATVQTDICFTHRVDGVWSAPAVLAEIPGPDTQVAAAAGPGGDMAVAWINRQGDFGSEKVYATLYDGELQTWDTPETISDLPERADSPARVAFPAVGYDSLGNPVATWSHKVVLAGDFLSRSLATAQHTADGGWQLWALLPKQNDATLRNDGDGIDRGAGRGISPPWDVPKEDCCEKEKKDEPKPDPKPDPPDPRPDDDDDDDDWDGDDEHDVDGTESADPNEKHGPEGFGDRNAVAAEATMSYTILFENKSDAGPASVVRITDELEEGYDLRRFRLGEFAWGDTIIEVPENRPFHLQTIRLDSGMDLTLLGTVDPRTRMATWEFRTTDPETGDIPENPLLGFLPPNDENHAGEGHVTFFITPAEDIVGGTEVKNDATIIFDTNEAIITNETSHLVTRANIDTGVGLANPPSSRAPVVETFDGDFLTVAWGVHDGSDEIDLDAPGAGFDVYYAVGDGPYTLWKSGTKETSASLSVTRGLTYRFYSIARDGAGNSEEAPDDPDLTVRILHDAVTIRGVLTYTGGAPGALVAVLEQTAKARPARSVFTQQAGSAGNYAFPAEGDADLPGEGVLYSVVAFVDVDGNGTRGPAEPFAEFADNPLDPVGRAPGIVVNLVLADVDGDGDGLPDWWEQENFQNLDAEYYDDADGDGVPTGIELAKGTDPDDPADSPTKGTSTGPVIVAGGQLYVDNAAFSIRGVLLRSVPPGSSPESVSDADRGTALKRDIPLVRDLGANAVRTSLPMADADLLDACADQGLKVIIGIPVDTSLDLADAAVRAAIAADFAATVAEFADHEALLMWCIGDGVNADLADDAAKTAWYELLNLLGWVAYEVEGQDYHPVTTANAGLDGVQNLGGVDLWGVNAAGDASFENRAENLFADFAALNLDQPMWLSSYGVSAWSAAAGREDELSQAQTDLTLAQAVDAAAGTPGVFAADDLLLAVGDAQDVATGDPGIRANLAFDDADGNGRPDAAEAVWADAVDSQPGSYEFGFDADVPLDGVVPATDGAAGMTGNLAFHDANDNGQWDVGEDVWADTDAEGALDRVFDERTLGATIVADTLVYTGDTVEVADGTPGIRGVVFADANDSGAYDTGEPIWSDRDAGSHAVYDAAVDTLLAGTAPADGTPGTTRGLFLADTNAANGVWDQQEDVWFAEPGQTVGGVLAELLDVWSASGSAGVHDNGEAEYFGLVAYDTTAGGDVRLRLAYETLRNYWGGGSADTPVIADTQVVTNEDQPVTFSVRATGGTNHEFRIRTTGAHGTLSGWNDAGPLNAVTYTPAANFAGADRIVYDVVNTATRTAETGSILVQVVPQDDPPGPLTTNPDQALISVAENDTLSLPVTVVEPDGDPVSITTDDLATLAGATLTDAVYNLDKGVWEAVLSWTPGYDIASLTKPESDFPVTFAASDSGAARTTVTLDRTLRVSNTNRAPTTPDSVVMNPDRNLAFANNGVEVGAWSYSDPDGDPQDLGALQVRWYKRTADRGEEMIPEYSNTTTLAPDATVPGDFVFCRVWPSDGADPAAVPDDQVPEGVPGESADVEILNDLASVTITPTTARTADPLTADPQWLDPNLPFSNVQIQWLETTGGGETVVAADGTLDSDLTARGRSFVARATAYRDVTRADTMMSLPVDSSAVTIADTPPPAPQEVAYDRARPQAGEAIQVLVGTVPEDADGDDVTLEYEWSLDPAFPDPVLPGEALPADTTQVRDQWIARVRATAPDGSSRGTAVSPWVTLDSVPVGLVTQDLDLTLGWNLLSFAVVPVDDPDTAGADESTAAGLFGDLKFGNAWYWRNDPDAGIKYVDVDATSPSDTLRQLQGVWVYHTPADSRAIDTQLPVDGWTLRPDDPHHEDSLTLQPGWNIIGVPKDTDTMPHWLLNERISLPLWFYSNLDGQGIYDAAYGTEGLKKGVGYWIFLHGDDPLPIDMTPPTE